MSKYIDIHTHSNKKNSTNVFSIFNALNNKNIPHDFCSIGIHPWEIKDIDINQSIEKVELNSKINHVIALGEIGLDRSIKTPMDEQLLIFKQQRSIAEKYKIPIIIHCVKAYADFFGIIKQSPNKTPWIFHGFSGNSEIANKLIENKCYLSFGERLMHSEKLQNIFAKLPLENIFLETDEATIGIEEIYAKAASLKGIEVEFLKEVIQGNFQNIFPNI